MCTLIIGRDLLTPRSVLLCANRDEDPSRPSDPPGVLDEHPRRVGGRDRRAGGTWLAIREGRAAVAILNRRDGTGEPAPTAPDRRSRGALALEVAGVAEDPSPGPGPAGESRAWLEHVAEVSGPGLSYAALRRTLAAVREASYAPFTLVFASPEACWLVALDADAPPRCQPIPSGWHVLTHADLDDPTEPRTARLVSQLAGFRPISTERAEQRLEDLMRSHGDPAGGIPPVCLHAGRMVTVSASSVWLAPGEARYRHADGRPCENPFLDRSHLLRASTATSGRP